MTVAAKWLTYVPPEVAEARAFEECLRYAERHGSFLALTVKMNLFEQASDELTVRFATRALDLERVFLASLRQAASEVGPDWAIVVNADAADRRSEDWRNLNHLIASQVIPQVEQAVIQNAADSGKAVLAYHLNWLQRYDQVVMLSRIAQAVQEGQLHGAWLLIPASPNTEIPCWTAPPPRDHQQPRGPRAGELVPECASGEGVRS